MASSLNLKKNYDVFLSFRGIDLRKNFIGHLYTALDQKGVYTFIDSEELMKGDQISAALMKAIEESRIAIIVFSEDYASSSWCLEEAAKIMECKEQGDLKVFPVFYKVEPREVRTPRESYNKAMVQHEFKFGKDSEKMKRWKKALFDASGLSGWPLNEGNESELIQEIVKKILTYLAQTSLHVAKHPVGIDSRVAKLKSMLNLKSHEDVVMVGLWGHGGIGKTTLSKALYNAILRQFDGSCFLANVREASKNSKDLVPLQEKLLFEISSLQQKLEVSNVDRGIILIQRRLCHKKVLLVLDDVDDLRQLEALAGGRNWFGNGSRIIVTTRDKHLLTYYGIDQDHMYEVTPLSYHEARELLSNHAFLTLQELEIRKNLVDNVLNHAGGLPLALEVLGSCLRGKREDVWESTLNKVSTIPNKTINEVLKISYDGLEENEQEVFLDVACFFKWEDSKYIKKVLESCNVQTTVGFDILIDRSLISIVDGILHMHDLIQLMGMDIVRQECRDDPRSRSRLWRYDDVADALSSDVGDCVVKAIVLEPPELKELSIHPNAFSKMRKLRLLILRNVHIPFHGSICLPNELRWMEFAGSGPWIPDFPSSQKKLVSIDMRKCNITEVVKHFKDFQQLRYIKLCDCELLISTPNISCTPNLEELKLRNCKNLVEAHESIAYHDKLQVLHFKWCPELCVFPNVLKSKNLRDLKLSNCPKLERFPDIIDELRGLKKLSIRHTSLKELPTSIKNLVSLEKIHLDMGTNPISRPSNNYKLQKLQWFKSFFCQIVFPNLWNSADPCMKIGLPNSNVSDLLNSNLSQVEFLEDLSCFPLLKILILSGNNITSLSTSIKRDCLSTSSISKDFKQLTYVKLSDCESLVITPNLSCAPNLKELKLWNCKNLVEAHESIANHDKLQVLHFKWCPELRVFPNVLKSKNLRNLNFSVCPKFERFPDIPHELGCLKKLSILHTAIKELPTSIENLVSLETMQLDICKNSVSIPSNIYKLQKLQFFKSAFGPIVFPNLTDSANPCMKVGLSNVTFLDLLNCNLSEVEFLEDLSCFPLLKNLLLSGNNITSLPISISKRDRLIELSISYCHQLQEIPKLPPFLKFLLANGCESLQTNGHLTSIDQWVHRGLTVVDTASIAKRLFPCTTFVLPKGEMPKWLQPVEDGFVSFMASKDLYDKFLGLIFCGVRNNEGDHCILCFRPYFNGKVYRGYGTRFLGSDPSGILINYFAPFDLWGAFPFDQIDGSYAQFNLKLESGFDLNLDSGVNLKEDSWVQGGEGVKKWGFRIICKQLEDDLKVTLRDNKLIDPAFLYEVGHDSTDPEVESLHVHGDNPIEMDQLKNLQESSHMLENRLIEFDLDCPPSSYELRGSIDMRYREFNYPGCFLPGDPRSLGNKKYKLRLEDYGW
ncbi:hypothetical protein ACJRO7_020989 [Eucalyptus globulus]|uniref:TIR domain-containing protein n=1 Tax=Eucalyptus globulus TaxID=34317 RepID=A0ABD3KN93_EUCGL